MNNKQKKITVRPVSPIRNSLKAAADKHRENVERKLAQAEAKRHEARYARKREERK